MFVIYAYLLFTDLLFFKYQNSAIEKVPKQWYDELPNCPCKNPDFDKVKLNDNWAKDEGDLETYHTGAKECFRSYPFVKTSEGNSYRTDQPHIDIRAFIGEL